MRRGLQASPERGPRLTYELRATAWQPVPEFGGRTFCEEHESLADGCSFISYLLKEEQGREVSSQRSVFPGQGVCQRGARPWGASQTPVCHTGHAHACTARLPSHSRWACWAKKGHLSPGSRLVPLPFSVYLPPEGTQGSGRSLPCGTPWGSPLWLCPRDSLPSDFPGFE